MVPGYDFSKNNWNISLWNQKEGEKFMKNWSGVPKSQAKKFFVTRQICKTAE